MVRMSAEMLAWERYSRTGHAYDAKRDLGSASDQDWTDLMNFLRDDCGLSAEEMDYVEGLLVLDTTGIDNPHDEPAGDRKRAKDVRRAKDAPPSFRGRPAVGRGPADRAMDEALSAFQQVREAEQATRPVLGEGTLNYDTAEGMYRAALSRLGVNTRDLHPSALKTVYETARRQRHTGGSAPLLATDSARRNSGVLDRWPLLNKVKHA